MSSFLKPRPLAVRLLAVSVVVGGALVTGCSFMNPKIARPEGQDCMMVGATFRETPGGVGPEVYDIDGKGFATVSWYAECPTDPKVASDVASSWVSYWKDDPKHNSGRPIAATKEHTSTAPDDGVMYRYTKYTLFFRGCDFWYNSKGGDPSHMAPFDDFNSKCQQPSLGSEPPVATAAASTADDDQPPVATTKQKSASRSTH